MSWSTLTAGYLTITFIPGVKKEKWGRARGPNLPGNSSLLWSLLEFPLFHLYLIGQNLISWVMCLSQSWLGIVVFGGGEGDIATLNVIKVILLRKEGKDIG